MAKRDFGSASFANEMKKTMEKAEAKGNSVTAINIRLDLIDENPDNNSIFNMDDIERLAKTIEQDGFSGAIEVFLKEDGRYEISAGHRRYRAVKMLGWETIPAIVSSSEDEIKKRKKLVKSNINNRNMKPMDWARTIDYHKSTLYMEDAKANGRVYVPGEPYTCSRQMPLWDRMEEDFGFKKTTMLKYLKLLKLIPELQKMVDAGNIPPLAVSNLGNEPEDVQRFCYEEMKEQLSLLVTAENEEPALPTTTVLNIIKAAAAKKGMYENKVKRNEEYFNYVANQDSLADNRDTSFNSAVEDNESVSTVYEPLPFQHTDVAAAPAPFVEPMLNNNIEQKFSNIPINKPVVPIPPISAENVAAPVPLEKEITYFDSDIIRVSNELNLIANRDIAIKDKDNIIEKLNQIEEFIKVIKKKIKE